MTTLLNYWQVVEVQIINSGPGPAVQPVVAHQVNGDLYYDAAGAGNTAVLIATFSNSAVLTAADIEVT